GGCADSFDFSFLGARLRRGDAAASPWAGVGGGGAFAIRESVFGFIVFRDVSKSFFSQNGTPALVVFLFFLELEKGEFFCLLGPSGCGKTTVLSMAAGFERPTEGEILLEGRPVSGPSRDRGVVFQGDDSLYPWLTALDNVAFGPKLAGQSK